jgi:serine/threonine protein kinase
MESLIGQTLDSYKILEIIGRGGMGVVFRALDTNLDKIVALKMIDPTLAKDESFVRRFKTEARALAKLDNPNIVGVYALRETRPYFFMVMEFVEARPLSQYIRDNGKLKLKEVINISKQLLSAISFAHKAEIIHRDIKPSNVLLCNNGLIKVTDFGLAKLIKSHDTGATVTQARAGTLYYMSPEQVKGLKNVDKRGDIYSLGMTIYEMTVGRVPFDKTDSDFTIQRKIVDGEIPSPITFCKDVPKKLIRIILKSIDKDPDKRYQTADDMLEDIRKFEKDLLDDEKTVIIPTGKVDVNRKSLFQKPAFMISGFLFLIGLALVYFLLIVPGLNNTQKAFVSLSTHPPDAIIKVNDEVIENSDLDKIVFDNEGDVKLQISKSGFKPIDTLIRTEFGKTISLAFNLVPNPATSGRLSVSTNPSGAKIYINQNPAGDSPIQNVTATSGKVNLNINKTGYDPIDTSINIIEGKENLFSFTLNKTTEFGGLNVTSDPAGAGVWLDWKRMGTTPFDKSELPAGSHQLLIRKNGFADYKQTVKIPVNKLIVIPTVKLTRLGKLTVITEPADAEIIIDNKSVGKGEYTNDKMNIGEHNIMVRKNGFKSYNEKIKIEVNKPLNISAKLSPLVGKVEILVRPYGNIFIDDQLKKEGTSSPYTTNLSGGLHNLKVVHPTLGEWIKKIEIEDETPRKYLVDFTKKMRLTVVSDPGNAEIYINGKPTDDRTPKVLELKPGSYKIMVKKENFYPSPEKELNVSYDIYESIKVKENKISFGLKKIE